MGYWVWNTKLIRKAEQERAVSTFCCRPGCKPASGIAVLEVVLKPPKPWALSPTAAGVCEHVGACAERRVHINEPCSPLDKPHLLHSIGHLGSPPAQATPLGMEPVPAEGPMGMFKSPILDSCSGQALRSQQGIHALRPPGPTGTITSFVLLLSMRSSLTPSLLPSLPSSLFSRENLDPENRWLCYGVMWSLSGLPWGCCWLVSSKRGKGIVSGLLTAMPLEPCEVPGT